MMGMIILGVIGATALSIFGVWYRIQMNKRIKEISEEVIKTLTEMSDRGFYSEMLETFMRDDPDYEALLNSEEIYQWWNTEVDWESEPEEVFKQAKEKLRGR